MKSVKPNLLSLIGSIVGLLAIAFMNTPYYSYSSISNTRIFNIANLLGIRSASSEVVYYESGFTVAGFFVGLSFFAAFVALIITIVAIINRKNVSDKVLILSSVNLFTAYITVKDLTALLSYYNRGSHYTYSLGWGIIVVLTLFVAFFVFALIGFIKSQIADKKRGKEKQFEEICKYKKLYDEGILTKEEFDEKKKELIL